MVRPDSRNRDLESKGLWVGLSSPEVKKTHHINTNVRHQEERRGGALFPALSSSCLLLCWFTGSPGFPGKAGAPGPAQPQAEKVSRTPKLAAHSEI